MISADDSSRTPDELIADPRLSATDRQLLRLWLAFIDGCVPTHQLAEAWQLCHAIRAVYRRVIQEREDEA